MELLSLVWPQRHLQIHNLWPQSELYSFIGMLEVYIILLDILCTLEIIYAIWIGTIYFTVPLHSRDREQWTSTSHRETRSVYVPPAKRIDARSSESHSSDHRERRPREHDERELRRERQRRSGRGGGGTSGRGGRHSRAPNKKEPDYVRNPSKWTKYDLKEDGSQVLRGMSQDQVNKYAAFQFLDEIQKRKSPSSLTAQRSDETGNAESDKSDEVTKVVFKRPSKSVSRVGKKSREGDGVRSEGGESNTRGHEGHSASGEGGIKMAEYVVGSKAAAQLHRERRRQKKPKLVSLHSEELEEDGGERGDGGDNMDGGCDGDVAEIGGSETIRKRSKAVKKRTVSSAIINLSHLAEEEEDT